MQKLKNNGMWDLTCSSFHLATCVGASHAFTFASSAGAFGGALLLPVHDH